MKKSVAYIKGPSLGCKIGKAYQIMLGQLAAALTSAGVDITTSEYLVLRAVYSTPGLQQCEIADSIGKDKAAVCRCVSSLEKKGLLATESVSHKCLKIYLTDRAREIEPIIMEVAASRDVALSELLSRENLEIFNKVLDKIITSN